MTEQRPENKHVIGYYCPEHGSDIEDISIIDKKAPYSSTGTYDEVFWIKECAAYAWRYHDAYEWIDGAKLVLVVDGKEVASATVKVEYNPYFYATEFKIIK